MAELKFRLILAPYVPTPPATVYRMLEIARAGPDDIVYDLGCGDGRICITAAKDFGARAVGFDIEPYWVEQSAANAAAAGVEHLTSFHHADACDTDISQATVVALYLVHSSMQTMAREVLSKLRPGTRIISHSFPIEGWEPSQFELFHDPENGPRKIFLWVAGDGATPSLAPAK